MTQRWVKEFLQQVFRNFLPFKHLFFVPKQTWARRNFSPLRQRILCCWLNLPGSRRPLPSLLVWWSCTTSYCRDPCTTLWRRTSKDPVPPTDDERQIPKKIQKCLENINLYHRGINGCMHFRYHSQSFFQWVEERSTGDHEPFWCRRISVCPFLHGVIYNTFSICAFANFPKGEQLCPGQGTSCLIPHPTSYPLPFIVTPLGTPLCNCSASKS